MCYHSRWIKIVISVLQQVPTVRSTLLMCMLHRRQRRRGRRGRGDPPPNILTSVLFFSLQWIFWIPQVAVIFICNAPSVHHITPFWEEKFTNFPGRCTHPSPPTAPRFSRLRRSTCDPPMFQWRLRPWLAGKATSAVNICDRARACASRSEGW